MPENDALVRPVCFMRLPSHAPFRPPENHPGRGGASPTGPVAPQTTLRTRFLSPNVLLGLPDDFPKGSEGFLRVWLVTLAKPVKRMGTGRTGIPSPPVPGGVQLPVIGMGRGNLDHPKHPDYGTHVSGRLFMLKNDLRWPVAGPIWPRC